MRARTVLGTIHRYLGFTTGIVLIVSATTGLALLYQAPLERALYPERFAVSAGPSQGLDSLADAAGIARQELRLVELPRASADPVVFFTGSEGNLRRTWVDPVSGERLGVQNDRDNPLGIVFLLHTHLLAGESGELLLGWLGISAMFLLVTGIYLWWPGLARLSEGFRVRRAPPVRFWRELHKFAGIIAAPLLLMQIGTGVALIFYGFSQTALDAVTGSETSIAPPRSTWNGRSEYSMDSLLDRARSAIPEATPTYLELPASSQDPLAVRLRLPGERHPNGRTFVMLDPASGEVLLREHAFDTTATKRILNALYPWHTGDFGGVLHRGATTLVALAVVLLAGSGAWFWWLRKRPRQAAPVVKVSPGI